MRKINLAALAACAAVGIVGSSALAAPPYPQGSVTLLNSDVKLCYANNLQWSLSKDVNVTDPNTFNFTGNFTDDGNPIFNSPATVAFRVTATPNPTGADPATLTVFGILTVQNTASQAGDVGIGNIVINLQKRLNNNWVSAAADIAAATANNLNDTANILAAASTEVGPLNITANYTITGPGNQIGTFETSAGSGTLSFVDQDFNSAFCLANPADNYLHAGQIRHLVYTATFDPVALQLNPGDQLRVEAIVTFANAGLRGGSGASSTVAVDVNMDGGTTTTPGPYNESNVRSVPSRVSLLMPALEQGNASVVLKDSYPDDVNTTGTVTTANPTDFTDGDSISAAATISPILNADGGADGGDVANTAHLDGQDQYDDITTTLPDSFGNYFVRNWCVHGVHLNKTATAHVNANVQHSPPPPGVYCTLTQGGWGAKPHGNNGGALLLSGFSTAYPGGSVVIGAGSLTATFTTTMTTFQPKGKNKPPIPTTTLATTAIQNFLPQGRPPAQFTSATIDPQSTSAGVLAGQVLTLKLNVDFSTAGLMPSGLSGTTLGNLHVYLNSLYQPTVSQILADANNILAGLPSAYGLSYSAMNNLCDNINNAFDECSLSNWAQQGNIYQ